MGHSWGSLKRMVEDRQRWTDFAAALTPESVMADDDDEEIPHIHLSH